ncbi:MAG: ATP phosphoribosyltransferase regulatory subunit [Clostridiales bacterium]|nr:ATP phosphoribosyltransferase regulatory subunit [Clostridiales bacterium]
MKNSLLHTPEGVRDIYNQECAKKSTLQSKINKLLKLYGYHDIQTPTFEFFDIFNKERGSVSSHEMYKFFDREGNTLVLRPDITPSIARSAAKYFMDEDMPIRLCYMGNTYINTSSYQGLLKETTQIGCELIGDNSASADAEMVSLVIQSLLKAGLKEFQVEVGQVDFFKGLVEESGIDQETEFRLRNLLENKNYFGVEELLSNQPMSQKQKEIFLKLSGLFGSVEILSEAKEFTQNTKARKAIERLEKVYEILKDYELEKYVSFELGMTGHYGYYTGIIFKAYTYGTGDSIVTGGRYDNLLKQFGKNSPSIGFGLIVDQLMVALSRQKIDIPIEEVYTMILYAPSYGKLGVQLADYFRKSGDNIELNPMKINKTLEDYKEYARRNHVAGILYMENETTIQVINVIENTTQLANLSDFIGGVQ